MKTIFIPIRDGEVSKTLLQTAFLPMLSEKVSVVLFVQKNKLEYFRETLKSNHNIVVEMIPSPTFPRIEEIFSAVFLYSLHTESIKIKIEYARHAGGSSLMYWAKRVLWWSGAQYLVRSFWRTLYHFLPDRSFDEIIKQYSPDLIFAANLISNEDGRLIKAAYRYGIKSIGMPKGWDNLTLKTFLSVFPDHLLVQTSLMKEDAVGLLDYPSERITITGFPKFDVYASKEHIMPRDQFLYSMGLDPAKKMILYAGAGDQLAPHDEDILRDLVKSITKGEFSLSVQILVRPHPKYKYRSEIIPPSSLWVLDIPGTMVDGKAGNFEFGKEDVFHLMNSLVHCDLLVHTASTLGIEAAIFDKPSISIAYDGDASPHPAVSVARYYRYVHLRRVLDRGGMRLAHSFEELVEAIKDCLSHPEKEKEERRITVLENAGAIDGKAGERVAHFILERLGL